MSLFLSRRYFDRRFDAIEGVLEKIMATQQDLDAALDAFEAAATQADQADQAAEQEIQATVNAILAKVPSVDLSAEVARLQAAQQKRAQASQALKDAADSIASSANPPPPPTPSPAPGPTPPAGRR